MKIITTSSWIGSVEYRCRIEDQYPLVHVTGGLREPGLLLRPPHQELEHVRSPPHLTIFAIVRRPGLVSHTFQPRSALLCLNSHIFPLGQHPRQHQDQFVHRNLCNPPTLEHRLRVILQPDRSGSIVILLISRWTTRSRIPTGPEPGWWRMTRISSTVIHIRFHNSSSALSETMKSVIRQDLRIPVLNHPYSF